MTVCLCDMFILAGQEVRLPLRHYSGAVLAIVGTAQLMLGGISLPRKPLHKCKHAGCTTLISDTYCAQHKPVRSEIGRKSNTERGYTYKWRQASKQHLIHNPLCAECTRQGKTTPASEVDHITPHRGNMTIFWDRTNWQSLCHSCHSRKTAAEDGGFGNPRGIN